MEIRTLKRPIRTLYFSQVEFSLGVGRSVTRWIILTPVSGQLYVLLLEITDNRELLSRPDNIFIVTMVFPYQSPS